MSRSKNKGNPTDFFVQAADLKGGSDASAKIKIFDGHGALCGEGDGSVSLKLPKGLYTARIERFGEMREEVIIHRETTDREVDIPRRNSAMPMSDTTHTHEFLQCSAIKYSTQSTFKQIGIDKNWPRLMIMVRGSGEQSDQGVQFFSDLVLFNSNGRRVSNFAIDQKQPPQSDVFAVYSALLKPGNYILSSLSGKRRQMLPISLNGGWDNFIFIPYQKRPKLSASSIKVVRHDDGYDPNDELSAKIDAALLGLGSRLDLLNPEDRSAALYGKFSHPLLGLIGAHSHFLGKDRKEKLEAMVLSNLWSLMPGAPDVIALLLMKLDRDEGNFPQSKAELDEEAKRAFGEKISGLLPLTFPPMLNSAMQAIMRATQSLPDLVKEESWLEAAGNSSFGSGPWALWDQPTWHHPDSKEPIRKTYGIAMPSTQKLYPAIKKAIANVSIHATSEIIAQASIVQFINPTQFNITQLMKDVNERVPDYSLGLAGPSVKKMETIRDLMRQIRETATPRFRDEASMGTSSFKPHSQVEDWLVNLVHHQIAEDSFDAGKVAKQYAVSKRGVERAAAIARSTNNSNSIT